MLIRHIPKDVQLAWVLFVDRRDKLGRNDIQVATTLHEDAPSVPTKWAIMHNGSAWLFGVVPSDTSGPTRVKLFSLTCVLFFFLSHGRPLEECMVTLGGYGGRVFKVAPDGEMGKPLALTIAPQKGKAEGGDSVR